jgi:hypothetical protein
MVIKFDNILKIEPEEYKVHFAIWNRHDEPLDLFVEDENIWRRWNEWKYDKDDFNRKYIFSLMRFYPRSENHWLFGGIWCVKAIKRGKYDIELDDIGKEYFGRLLIEYKRPTNPGRSFYFEKHYHKMIVSEIFGEKYSGASFCGFENINHDFKILKHIFKINKDDWKTALMNIKGIYLLTDKKTGKMYVGSAYGESGIWSRWACYLSTSHGWNDELMKLIREKGDKYAHENFKLSLLEYHNMKTADEKIIERETYWKEVLLSRDYGHNKN